MTRPVSNQGLQPAQGHLQTVKVQPISLELFTYDLVD